MTENGSPAKVSPATLLRRLRIVPVVTLEDAGIAAELAATLLEGGITCAEFTLRTPAGVEAVRRAASVPGFHAGAGTVLDLADLERCVDAGANFLVAPGLDAELVLRAQELGAAFLPGIATPTELQQARRLGLDAVKVFPAAQLGGSSYLKALAAPFPGFSFLPSGGIGAGAAAEYLALPSVAAVSGSWMVPAEAIAAGELETIRQLAAESVSALGLATASAATPMGSTS